MLCPKCGGDCFDETKSKFWNGGKTKEGKNKPRWKCKRKGECDGVAWDAEQATTSVPAATATALSKERKSDLYDQITRHTLAKIIPLYREHSIPITMEGTAAIIATLYISATRD